MDVTAKLLRVFLVEKQIRGLQTRLRAAERFLNEQTSQVTQLDAKKAAIDAQLKQLTAVAKQAEGEVARLDARMATLRDQMNGAQTNKEYKAFLTELNTFKLEKDKAEQSALESMTKIDELKKQAGEIETQREERDKLRGVAVAERDARAAEIKERLDELTRERVALAADVPGDSLRLLERLVHVRGEGAMAPIEIQDRKRHEFTCGSCQMSLPLDTVSGLMSKGKLTTCVSCGCILYLGEEEAKSLQPAANKR
jgi:predicted  nucleic acid-binding Zn-ribbon protein